MTPRSSCARRDDGCVPAHPVGMRQPRRPILHRRSGSPRFRNNFNRNSTEHRDVKCSLGALWRHGNNIGRQANNAFNGFAVSRSFAASRGGNPRRTTRVRQPTPECRRSSAMLRYSVLCACAALGLTAASAAHAATAQPMTDLPSMTMTVSGGCGPHGWRGKWGACHFNRGYNGARWYGPRWYGGPVWGNGCAPGYWRGPWGHCRNTPYHGRLPNGNWR